MKTNTTSKTGKLLLAALCLTGLSLTTTSADIGYQFVTVSQLISMDQPPAPSVAKTKTKEEKDSSDKPANDASAADPAAKADGADAAATATSSAQPKTTATKKSAAGSTKKKPSARPDATTSAVPKAQSL